MKQRQYRTAKIRPGYLPGGKKIEVKDFIGPHEKPTDSFFGRDNPRSQYWGAKAKIYFVTDRQRVKIGFTARPWTRLRELENAEDRAGFQMLALHDGTRWDEAFLHERFDHLALGQEWFVAAPELMKFIAWLEHDSQTPR